jgi:hypothetical protein
MKTLYSCIDYYALLNEILFEQSLGDPLFKDGLMPYEIDKYRFIRAVKNLQNPKDQNSNTHS